MLFWPNSLFAFNAPYLQLTKTKFGTFKFSKRLQGIILLVIGKWLNANEPLCEND